MSFKAPQPDVNSHPTTEASSSVARIEQPDPSHPHTHTDPPLPNTIPLVDLSKVQEPEVDTYWKGQNGKIERKRDSNFCRHGEKGMCDYCMPLEVSIKPLTELTIAIRLETPSGEPDQTPLLPRLPSQTPLLPLSSYIFGPRATPTQPTVTLRRDALSHRFPSTLPRWNLLNVSAVRPHPLISVLQNGRSCRVCFAKYN